MKLSKVIKLSKQHAEQVHQVALDKLQRARITHAQKTRKTKSNRIVGTNVFITAGQIRCMLNDGKLILRIINGVLKIAEVR